MIDTKQTDEHIKTHQPKRIEISVDDFDNLSWGDPSGEFAKEWMRYNGIAQGQDIIASVTDEEGVVHEKRVTTSPNDFFTVVRDKEPDVESFEDDYDSLGDLEHAQIVTPGHFQEVQAASIRETYADTRTVEMGSLSSDEELADLVERARADDALESVKTLIQKSEFQPVAGIRVGDIDMAFSPVFLAQKRKYIVAYVNDENDPEGKIKPRLFYESNSDGGWRATPGFYEDSGISKGDFTGDEYGQYVQVTKPVEQVAAMLDALSRQELKNDDVSKADLESVFTLDRPYTEEGKQFESEVDFTMIGGHGVDAFVPGFGYRKHGVDKGRDMLEDMKLPEGFEPDFTVGPDRRYAIEHTLLGKSGVDVFTAKFGDRDVEWHVAHDKSGRIWIERLIFADAPITAYGTSKDVILAGALNLKPIEYRVHLEGEESVDYETFSKVYVDIGKTINRMPWAKRFREATGIY